MERGSVAKWLGTAIRITPTIVKRDAAIVSRGASLVSQGFGLFALSRIPAATRFNYSGSFHLESCAILINYSCHLILLGETQGRKLWWVCDNRYLAYYANSSTNPNAEIKTCFNADVTDLATTLEGLQENAPVAWLSLLEEVPKGWHCLNSNLPILGTEITVASQWAESSLPAFGVEHLQACTCKKQPLSIQRSSACFPLRVSAILIANFVLRMTSSRRW